MNQTRINQRALVVLSGGQDSVTCLGYALSVFSEVQCITFDYNQRHVVEIECARKLCSVQGIPHRIVSMGDLLRSLVTSALTGIGDVGQPHAYKPGLPSSFVPGRNALFLTLAHAFAQEIGADAIITGVCQTDYSGYPDCRESFIRQIGEALNTGYETRIQILTPLMHLTKWQTFALAEEVGYLNHVLELSHTCYRGDRSVRHEWGYGCGACPACELRAKGWREFQENKLVDEDERRRERGE